MGSMKPKEEGKESRRAAIRREPREPEAEKRGRVWKKKEEVMKVKRSV
jgi:hypothetical protein